MHVIKVRNVNDALSEGLHWLHVAGKIEQSRNGPVLVAPGPVCTTYTNPTERVLFSHLRDANPYFHLMEALWMLAGHDDVAFPALFNSKIGQYSDDGTTFWGAYGFRWRHQFGYDQLDVIVQELKTNPESRRCVLSMWDAHARVFEEDASDLEKAVTGGKDVPCNTHAYFDCRDGVLSMTVLNRSNDAVWGCYGANAVHFSLLQEYLAARIGVPVGTYRQVSNNLHVYQSLPTYATLVPNVDVRDLYATGTVEPYPIMQTSDQEWRLDLERFLSDPLGDTAYYDPFFHEVAAPMATSWAERKSKVRDGWMAASEIAAMDWQHACLDWIERREAGAKERSC